MKIKPFEMTHARAFLSDYILVTPFCWSVKNSVFNTTCVGLHVHAMNLDVRCLQSTIYQLPMDQIDAAVAVIADSLSTLEVETLAEVSVQLQQ